MREAAPAPGRFQDPGLTVRLWGLGWQECETPRLLTPRPAACHCYPGIAAEDRCPGASASMTLTKAQETAGKWNAAVLVRLTAQPQALNLMSHISGLYGMSLVSACPLPQHIPST